MSKPCPKDHERVVKKKDEPNKRGVYMLYCEQCQVKVICRAGKYRHATKEEIEKFYE